MDAVQQFFSEFVQKGSRYHLWYVYQIIGLYLLMPFLKKIVDSCSRRELYLFLFVVLLQPTVFRMLNIVQSAVYIAPFLALMEGYVGFIVYGYLLGTQSLSKGQRIVQYFLGIFGLFAIVAGNYHYSSPEQINLFFNEGYCILHYLTAGALFLFIRTFFEKRETDGFSEGRIVSLLRRGSQLSYGIYLSHVFFLDCFGSIVSTLSVQLRPAQYVLNCFLAASVTSTALMCLVSRIPGLRRLLL